LCQRISKNREGEAKVFTIMCVTQEMDNYFTTSM
jgi:hypothetical protein